MSSCETCLSLVSVSDLLEQKYKTPLNETTSLTELICDKCPVMNKTACTKVIHNMNLIYKECDNNVKCPFSSCKELELC